MQDLYAEYKAQTGEIEKDLHKWRDVVCSYCQDVNFPDIDLWLQHNDSQNPSRLLYRNQQAYA